MYDLEQTANDALGVVWTQAEARAVPRHDYLGREAFRAQVARACANVGEEGIEITAANVVEWPRFLANLGPQADGVVGPGITRVLARMAGGVAAEVRVQRVDGSTVDLVPGTRGTAVRHVA